MSKSSERVPSTPQREKCGKADEELTMYPTTIPLRCPRKEALGMITDVSTREAKGVSHRGMLAKPKTLKLATPLLDKSAIHLFASTRQLQTWFNC